MGLTKDGKHEGPKVLLLTKVGEEMTNAFGALFCIAVGETYSSIASGHICNVSLHVILGRKPWWRGM